MRATDSRSLPRWCRSLSAGAALLAVGCTAVQTTTVAATPAVDGATAAEGTRSDESTCEDLRVGSFDARPSSFSLPAARCGHGFDALASTKSDFAWATLDLTGDRIPELVVVADGCDDDVGKVRWDVYDASASGFGNKPRSYALPAVRCGERFEALASHDADVAWETMDLTGDGKPDLVVTSDRCDDDIGRTRWDVYEGGADGFAATPRAFAIPAARCEAAFARTAGTAKPLVWSVESLAGKRGPDLLVTSDACDADVGRTHWDRYPWSESGFAATPTPYALPSPRCDRAFDALGSSQTTTLAWTTTDLSGDGRADLVVTSDACDADVATAHWDVYRGGESGFADVPAPFGLPASRCSAKLASTVSAQRELGWSLVDLGGGRHPELLVTSDACDTELGTKRWDAYAWSEAGFANKPRAVAVPAPRCEVAFDGLAGPGQVTYATLSLTSPCLAQIVVTHDACDEALGASRWDVHASLTE